MASKQQPKQSKSRLEVLRERSLQAEEAAEQREFKSSMTQAR
jgi:hypothetical protein